MIVEVRPGEGGADAELFAVELANKIACWIAADGNTVTVDPSNPRLILLAVNVDARGVPV